jgi:hypothetical protein
MNEYTILLAWDDEASRWYALNDTIPIILEDASLDTLIDRVKIAAPELLELNGQPHTGTRLLFKMERLAVDGEIRIRHVANGIMKQAGIDYHF